MSRLLLATAVSVLFVTSGCSPESSPTAPSSVLSPAPAAAPQSPTETSGRSQAPSLPVTARTIKIVQGEIVMPNLMSGRVAIRGTHGFVFNGTIHGEATVNPGEVCAETPLCVPGATVPLTGRWVGLDLPGTARLRGETLTGGGGLNSLSSLDLQLSGSFIAPPRASVATVTAPITLSGTFREPQEGFWNLEGTGTATVSLRWVDLLARWTVTSTRFEFRGAR